MEKKSLLLQVEIINGDKIDMTILLGAVERKLLDGFVGESGGYVTGAKYNWTIRTFKPESELNSEN